MKTKIFLLVLYIINYQLYNSQQVNGSTGITNPVPTLASLATYNNIPVSIQTGVPDISFPLISVVTNSKKVSINLGLNYHSGNTGNDQWVSNVGKGWTLLGPGVISREVVGDMDEKYDDATVHYYKKNEFKNIYNFSIPGESGKFRIIRDTVNNTYQVLKLTPYTSKIEYQRNNNTATLIIDSFTITSDTGIKYKFQEYDISQQNVVMWVHPNNGGMMTNRKYRSAYHLTSIEDEKNTELVKYFYHRDLKQVQGNPLPDEEYNKLIRIEVKDHAVIDLNTEKMGTFSNGKNDEFVLNSIVLKDSDSRFIKKYKFDYGYSTTDLFRVLENLKSVDENDNIIEKYKFLHTGISNGEPDNINMSAILLKRVYLPTGGNIEYNFEIAPYTYADKTITIPAPVESFGTVSFSNVNTGIKKYFFTVDSSKDIIIDANSAGNLLNYSWSLQFFKKVGNSYQIAPYSMGSPLGADPNAVLTRTIAFEPGEYYAEIYSNDLNVQMLLPAIFEASVTIGGPTESVVTVPIYKSVRIKNIKYFNDGIGVSTPSKVINYDYKKFNDPAMPSGVVYDEGVIYKNVKVTEGDGNGYSKYYFDTSWDYPQTTQPYWPNYNLTSKGILRKKEVYNTVNQIVSEDIFDYTMEEFDAPSYDLPESGMLVKTGWMKEEKVSSRNYFESGVLEAKKEIYRSPVHRNVILEKNISFDGSIQETSYKYALDTNNQKLITANMTGIPLETTSVIRNNASDSGKTIARSETRYDNAGNVFPSSAVSFDSQNNLASELTFNQYDAKGNLEQYTVKDGIPVSVVWGYNKTQPIAKVEGATYSQIAPYVSDIVSKSDADTNEAAEQSFQQALDLFRNNAQLKNYQITTYVYDVLVGMKSMTPPSGIREKYQYDKAGRLDQIIDEKGKVLKKYNYNYKH